MGHIGNVIQAMVDTLKDKQEREDIIRELLAEHEHAECDAFTPEIRKALADRFTDRIMKKAQSYQKPKDEEMPR